MRLNVILILIILAIIAGIAGFWHYQKNIYSKGVLKLEILGSSEAGILEEVVYTVKFKNNGNVTLENAELIFEYPDYSIVEGKDLLREEVSLDDIYPGKEDSFQFKARLLGKENEIKKARATLSYRPKSLKAFYESETSLITVINQVPLAFEFDLPSKMEAGREMTFSLNYFSSLDYPLSGLRAKVNYPDGFEFIESRPDGLDETEWEIGLLNKAEGGRVEIKGRLSAELDEQKIFQASLGVWQKDEFVLLKEANKGTKIIRPLLSVFQRINGEEDYVANFGEWLHYEIFFRNVGDEPFRHLFLITELEGQAFNFNETKIEDGQFNIGDSSIVWDWRDTNELQFLDRGEEGKVEFWVKLKDADDAGQDKKNGLLRNKAIISEIKEEFETKIGSDLEVLSKAYFEDEVFGNQGQIPPQAGELTTYTVVWQVENCCNDLNNVKVKSVLPKNVKMTGRIFPEDAGLTFDPGSREVIWEIGDLAANANKELQNQSSAFQISFTPDNSQQGKTPFLIAEAVVSAEDQWIEETISATAPAIDTSLPDDNTVTEQQGVVQ